MAEVWIAFVEVGDGAHVLGVYSTAEKAEKAMAWVTTRRTYSKALELDLPPAGYLSPEKRALVESILGVRVP